MLLLLSMVDGLFSHFACENRTHVHALWTIMLEKGTQKVRDSAVFYVSNA